MGDDYEVPGIVAFVRGLQLSALVLVLVLLFAYGRSAAGGLAFLARFGAEDLAAGATLLGLVVLLVLVLALSLPFYLSFHAVEVYVATGGTDAPVAPGTLVPGEYAPLLFLLPGAVLTWAGYRRARVREATSFSEHVAAGAAATVGYFVAAAVAIVPGAWLFDAGANALLSAAVPGTVDAVSLVYPNPVRVHLLVGVAYPLVFTAFGGVVAAALADGRGSAPADSGGSDGRVRD